MYGAHALEWGRLERDFARRRLDKHDTHLDRPQRVTRAPPRVVVVCVEGAWWHFDDRERACEVGVSETMAGGPTHTQQRQSLARTSKGSARTCRLEVCELERPVRVERGSYAFALARLPGRAVRLACLYAVDERAHACGVPLRAVVVLPSDPKLLCTPERYSTAC